MTIELVEILAGNRAGQFGELSELNAPAGQVYVRLPKHDCSRNSVLAKTAILQGAFGAVTLQPWENLEVSA